MKTEVILSALEAKHPGEKECISRRNINFQRGHYTIECCTHADTNPRILCFIHTLRNTFQRKFNTIINRNSYDCLLYTSGSFDHRISGIEVELDFLALLVEGPASDLRIAGWQLPTVTVCQQVPETMLPTIITEVVHLI